MNILNLYAGLGGNRKKWPDYTQVTAVEMDEKIAAVYSANNPSDTVVIGDAHDYLLRHHEEFDFIWSSPRCQSHSRMVKATRHKVRKYPDFSLYEEVIFLENFFDGYWLVENVKPYYEPLIAPRATIGRHIFWANFDVVADEMKSPKGFINQGTAAQTKALKDWLGIHYDGNIYYEGNHCPGQVLRNCVHPDVGLQIFNSMTRYRDAANQASEVLA